MLIMEWFKVYGKTIFIGKNMNAQFDDIIKCLQLDKCCFFACVIFWVFLRQYVGRDMIINMAAMLQEKWRHGWRMGVGGMQLYIM